MAKDLTRKEEAEIQDLDYLLKGYRNQIRAMNIYIDPAYFEREQARHTAMIAEHQRQLDVLRDSHANAPRIIKDCQKKIQALLKAIKLRERKADIERLLALQAKLNDAGVTDDDLDELRAKFGLTEDGEDE